MVTFMVYIFDLREQRYDIAIHEITELHQEETFSHFVCDLYSVLTIWLSPYHLGWPGRCPRKYTIVSRKNLK